MHLESEAIKTVIDLIEKGTWELLFSDVLDFEISNTSDEKKRRSLQSISGMAVEIINLTNLIKDRASYFESFGLQAFDAMHLACAENNTDILLTVDDRFIKKANKINNLKVKIKNPLQWLEEVL
ncbi:MAG: type II toxin-antitoxin system VapC family toxin [Methylococcales symbiont of Hymedesmia sp. n. MRB-2018]|nr:MAG: type II toxin-antitoxin system VapC family toxin [Methylococcales symbiont of Hymedesmia sp. n. MRB-2018]KAF3984408.1 MAG: type II toxin-antitoxin system VapC family toxin [Methylococcales symbiont of Hymedesmia sp. n. MRB-2018]